MNCYCKKTFSITGWKIAFNGKNLEIWESCFKKLYTICMDFGYMKKKLLFEKKILGHEWFFFSYLTDFSYFSMEKNPNLQDTVRTGQNLPFWNGVHGFNYFHSFFSYFIFWPQSSLLGWFPCYFEVRFLWVSFVRFRWTIVCLPFLSSSWKVFGWFKHKNGAQ